MARLPEIGADADAWGALLNEFLRIAHREDGTLRSTYEVTNVQDFGATTAVHAFATLQEAIVAANRTDGLPLSMDDSLPTIQAAIDASGLASDSKGGTVYIPKGFYVLRGNLRVSRCCKIIGAGSVGRLASTGLIFQDGYGMVFEGSTTSTDGSRADHAYMADVHIYNSKRYPNSTPGVNGIYARCTIHLERVGVTYFGGDGILIEAGEGYANTNANNWSLKNIWVEDNHNGLYIHGGNSNAGVAINVVAISNRNYGILNSAYLNATFVGCLAEGNKKSFRSEGGTNFSVWIGNYVEMGQEPEEMYSPAIVIGGDHGPRFSSDSTALLILTPENVSPMQVYSKSGVEWERLNVGMKNGSGVLGWQAYDDPQQFELSYGYQRAGWWELHRGGHTYFALSGAQAEGGAGQLLFPLGYKLGSSGQNPRAVNIGSTPPTSGRQGDLIYNTEPRPGGYVGWVCVKSETPTEQSEWKQFGQISQ